MVDTYFDVFPCPMVVSDSRRDDMTEDPSQSPENKRLDFSSLRSLPTETKAKTLEPARRENNQPILDFIGVVCDLIRLFDH